MGSPVHKELTYIFINLIRMQNFMKQFYAESRNSGSFLKNFYMSDSAATILYNKLSSLCFKLLSSFAGQRGLRCKSGHVIIALLRSVSPGMCEPNEDNILKQRSRKGPSFLTTKSRE